MERSMSRLLALASTTAILAGAASAEAPKVVVDIAPVHSLVARVMEGVGVPSLIVTPGASPHQYQMRPSQAAALQDADIVVWMSESLTPWLEETVETLSGTGDNEFIWLANDKLLAGGLLQPLQRGGNGWLFKAKGVGSFGDAALFDDHHERPEQVPVEIPRKATLFRQKHRKNL
jgi:hypothetical protein